MYRRRFLTCGGAVITGSLAGCLGNSQANTLRLAGGQVFNGDSESHQISLRLDRNGETVYEEEAAYSRNSGEDFGTIIPGDWSSAPATYAVRASKDNATEITKTLSAETDDCHELYVFTDADGNLVVIVKPIDSDRSYSCED